jgi:gamma-glutamylputrescine oxidase
VSDAARSGAGAGSPGAPAVPNVPAWEDGAWTPLPPLRGDIEADACVIGLGGSGLSCVLELLAMGRTVVGIDAWLVGGGAAGRNGGFLLAGLAAFYHDAIERVGHDRARRLYAHTMTEIERIARGVPDAVRITGSLRIAASPEEEEDCRRHLAALRADGFPGSWYEGAEGRGLLIESDGAFDPLRRCRALAVRALAAGARLHEGTTAVTIESGCITTDHGRIRCRQAIVAVDGRLERLLPELATRVRTARLQMLGTAPAPDVRIPRPVYSRWGLDYWQQLPDARVVLGGFRDIGGEGEWTHDDTPSPAVQRALDECLRARIGVRAPVTHRWAASVSYTPDGLPILARVRDGVWAIGAYSGTGNVVGAICGRAVARQAFGGPDEVAALLSAD